MSDCGHACCDIRSNPYHQHPDPPNACLRCLTLAVAGDRASPLARAAARVRRTVPPGPAPAPERGPAGGRAAPADDAERMAADVSRIVRTVLTRLAPEIAGLPAGGELERTVLAHAIRAYLDALDDPDLHGLDERQRATALAGRVGLALAFPATDTGTGA